MRTPLSASVLSLLVFAAVGLADQAPAPPQARGLGDSSPNPKQISGRPRFGTDDLTYVRFNGLDFYPYSGAATYVTSGIGRRLTAPGSLEASLHVPSGAVIDYLQLDACDTGGSFMRLEIFQCDPFGFNCASQTNVTTMGAGGCQTVSVSGIGLAVDNESHSLTLEVDDNAGDGTLSIANAIVGYRLQVSEAPAIATFDDVPTDHPYFQFIEALSAAGITAGCLQNPPLYCPDREITRGEMAVYMAKALGLHFPH
jgi:hypothetical protein